MTVGARNNTGICLNWSMTGRNWRIGASPCPRRTSCKMNPQCGRNNQLLQTRPPCRQSRSIISWNWRRTRTSVYGMARAISPIELEESWYVYRVHTISIDVSDICSAILIKMSLRTNFIYCNLINSNECRHIDVPLTLQKIHF